MISLGGSCKMVPVFVVFSALSVVALAVSVFIDDRSCDDAVLGEVGE
jgi:hypothetical protein